MRTIHLHATSQNNRESGRRTHIEHNHTDYHMINTYFSQMILRSNKAIAKIRYEANPKKFTKELKLKVNIQ